MYARPHPAEFRQRAVELARIGDRPVAVLARELRISESCLRNWMAQADADDGAESGRLSGAEKKELAELRRRNRQLLVQPGQTPFQHRNAQPRRPRSTPHPARSRPLTPHHRCPDHGVKLTSHSGAVACHSVRCRRTGDDDGVAQTVLVVDDHAEFRASARALLMSDGFEVVGEAGTGAEAIHAVRLLSPDVVLLDVKLPDVDGIAVAESLALLLDPPLVVLVSSRDAAAYGARLRNAPARGFLAKSDLSGASLRRLLTR